MTDLTPASRFAEGSAFEPGHLQQIERLRGVALELQLERFIQKFGLRKAQP